MCGGFTCSKNALIALNILYIVVGFILIGTSVYGRASAVITNLPIVGGIFACGVFLIFIAALGLVGAVKHHQVILFFYMIILFILFLVQFGFATACLTVSSEQQEELAIQGWKNVKLSTKTEVQKMLGCCGFDNREFNSTDPMGHPPCTIDCCAIYKSCVCPPCKDKLINTMNYAFDLCGGLGMFFSFTEFVGVWLTVRYRNQKDPRKNPSAFL
ncbi:tetraspanin-13 isoform X2 [Bemisia tabaci]|uniref:tetraspanin-13 isoform X2 n=1 Tax=Bemisia tabaci TaxID=7038 RepID=UPI0008F9B4E4|nr:PREDICTED: tetraspanin-13 isoform X2 [Bemisia tabaci]